MTTFIVILILFAPFVLLIMFWTAGALKDGVTGIYQIVKGIVLLCIGMFQLALAIGRNKRDT